MKKLILISALTCGQSIFAQQARWFNIGSNIGLGATSAYLLYSASKLSGKQATTRATLGLLTGAWTFYNAYQIWNKSTKQLVLATPKTRQDKINYYKNGTYEQEVAAICKQAEEHFSTIAPNPKNLVVFDYHDTITYFHNGYDLYFPNNVTIGTPIKPVVALFKTLRERNIQIIILCGAYRPTQFQQEQYISDCQAAGCTGYIDFIFTEDKAAKRQELAEKYTIIGCVGDRPSDFAHGNTGYQVKLPNHIY